MGYAGVRSARFAAPALTVLLAFPLTGCIAAAIPLALATEAAVVGATGFGIYKTVQTASGSSFQVAFPGKDGKPSMPPPLPVARRVAVWPGDEGDVRFADHLARSGRFDVTPPSTVSMMLTNAKIGPSLKLLTEQEQTQAFQTLCKESNADLIFASRDLGQSGDANAFSFSRAKITAKADLFGFSCPKGAIVWRDQIALIMEVGGSLPSSAEMNEAAAQAWADRVLQAPTI